MEHKGEGEILEGQLAEGLAALRRSAIGLFISALSGGLDVGFSTFIGAAVLTLLPAGGEALFLQRLMLGASYAIGFILVVLGRSELFTEQTTLAVLPVLHGSADLRQLGRLWGIVYAGNLVGAAIFAAIAALAGPALGAIDHAAFAHIAARTVSPEGWVIFVSGALAGWLMGLLSWLVSAARDTIGQLLVVVVITGSIGFLGLHHSIVGTTEVLAGIFAGGPVTLVSFMRFLALATVGNAFGGVVFVAVLKYSHAVRAGRLEVVDLAPPRSRR